MPEHPPYPMLPSMHDVVQEPQLKRPLLLPPTAHLEIQHKPLSSSSNSSSLPFETGLCKLSRLASNLLYVVKAEERVPLAPVFWEIGALEFPGLVAPGEPYLSGR